MADRKVFLRTLLRRRFDWMEERVLEMAREHGYSRVTPAMSRMFGRMSGRPVPMSDLARSLGVSRQAVHKLAKEAADLGLVEFVPCPENARVVRLQFTQEGWAMSAVATRDFENIEDDLKKRLGERDFNELRRLLAAAWDEAEAAPGKPVS